MRPGRGAAGVGDSTSSRPNALERRRDHPRRLARNGEVARDSEGVELGGLRLQPLRVTRAERERRALGRQLVRDRAAEAAARAADEGDLVAEPEVHVCRR